MLKINSSHNILLCIFVLITTVAAFNQLLAVNGEAINAEMGKTYQIDSMNSIHLPNDTMESPTYLYSDPIPDFNSMVVYYVVPIDQNFTFSISKLSMLRHFKFSANFTGQEKLFLDIVTTGIFNTDVSQMNVSIVGEELQHVLSIEGDEYGKLTRNCRKLSIELNLAKAVSIGTSGKDFYLLTSGITAEKEISVNQWIDVAYPSSYKLQTGDEWSRFFSLSFPMQRPVCDHGKIPPKFELTHVSNVNPKDISESNDDQLAILRAFMFYDVNNLEKDESTVEFVYQFNRMKDINGNEVQVELNSIACGSTSGNGYQFGTAITPIVPSSNTDGDLVCDMSGVLLNNSLIIVYGKIKKVAPPKPFISHVSDGTKTSGTITEKLPVFLVAETHDDSCISLDGTISDSSMAIYALQQKFNFNNPILPNRASYSDMKIVPTGSTSIKFCSNSTITKELDSDAQQMVFLLVPYANGTSCTYKLEVSIQPYWRVPVIIGVCVVAALVLVAVFITALVFWLYSRKKRYAYIDIQNN